MPKFYYILPPDDSAIATISEGVEIEFIDDVEL
ncbi:MAG: hypothetical protein ACI8WB_000716 [Phenylobacterium sp.]|jgi:hypothetical protein